MKFTAEKTLHNGEFISVEAKVTWTGLGTAKGKVSLTKSSSMGKVFSFTGKGIFLLDGESTKDALSDTCAKSNLLGAAMNHSVRLTEEEMGVFDMIDAQIVDFSRRARNESGMADKNKKS